MSPIHCNSNETEMSGAESNFRKAVQDFRSGDSSLLKNIEFVAILPHYLVQLFQNDNQSEAYLLLDRLGEYILTTKVADKEKGLNAIDVINNFAIASKQASENENERDFKSAVYEFRGGDISLLQSREFIQELPHHIIQLFQKNEEKIAYQLLDILGECILHDSVTNREKALMVFAIVNNLAIASGNILLIKKLFHLLLKWLEFETVYLVGFAVICQQLQRINQVLIKNNLQQEVYDLLNLISRIENGIIEKNEIIKNMIGTIRAHIAAWKNDNKTLQTQKATSEGDRIHRDNTDFDTTLRKFAEGDDSALHNQKFIDQFPHYIYQKYKNGIEPESLSLLERLGECLQNSNIAHREKGLIVVAALNDLSLSSKNLGLMQKLFRLLIPWLETETVLIEGFTSACKQLQRLGIELLRNDFWREAEILLEVTCTIKKSALVKNNEMPKKPVQTISQNEQLALPIDWSAVNKQLYHFKMDYNIKKPLF